MKKIQSVLVRLNKINYNVLESSEATEFKVKLSDSHELELGDDRFSVLVSRKVTFEPNELFYLSVDAEVEYELEDSNEPDGLEFTEEFIEDNIKELLTNNSTVFEHISSLISNITSSMGRVPIVTAPTYIE